MSTWNISLTTEFFEDFGKLPAPLMAKVYRVMIAMQREKLSSDFGGYRSEKVKGAEPGIYSCRADDSYRIIWKLVKPNDMVFCLVDQHDQAYKRAARKSFTLFDGVVKVADILEVGGTTADAQFALMGWVQPYDERVGQLFVGYRDMELMELGIPLDVLPHVRALNDVNQLEKVERLLPLEVYNKLLEIALGIIERIVIPDPQLRASLKEHQGGDELYRFVDSNEFERALKGEMADWMLFLAPMQRTLANRIFNGPARIRGVSGSGKTVVALHRTRYLARNLIDADQRVLFLTYGNRLPKVMEYLYKRLVGDGRPEADKVDFMTIHQWCRQFVQTHAVRNLFVVQEKVKKAIDDAINKEREMTPERFRNIPNVASFFSEEIQYSIKGRAITNLEEYLHLDRSGRGSPLVESQRKVIWDVYKRYEANLVNEGTCDYDDFILQALHLGENGVEDSIHAHVVVDEIQDLTEATLRTIRKLIPPKPDDLFLVGDGMQRIYPGGYALGRLGIDITGRGTLLRQNYRNTQQILQAAHAMVSSEPFDDLEDEDSQVVIPELSVRQGEVPRVLGFALPENEINWIVGEIQRLKDKHGYRDEEFTILYPRKPYDQIIVEKMKKFKLSLLTNDPDTYFGPGIKYTTYHSAKGLEFKVVFVVGVTDGQFMPHDDWRLEGKALDDDLIRQRSLLYVAMTRARDLLYLTYSRGQVSRFLNSIPKSVLKRG